MASGAMQVERSCGDICSLQVYRFENERIEESREGATVLAVARQPQPRWRGVCELRALTISPAHLYDILLAWVRIALLFDVASLSTQFLDS